MRCIATGAIGLMLLAPTLASGQQASQEGPQDGSANRQQETPGEVARDESAFVIQAPERTQSRAHSQVAAPQQATTASSVYFPEAITPEAIANARSTQQAQLEAPPSGDANGAVTQVSTKVDDTRDVIQLSDGDSARALAQLSNAERQVLLQAVEGTDICERGSDIPAIKALCDGRIENRSAEFTQETQRESAEDRLLGGGLDSTGVATLEAAIARLARNGVEPDNFSNQVIASVGLNNPAPSDTGAAAAADGDPTSDLSPETQAVVNAIVQQLGGS